MLVDADQHAGPLVEHFRQTFNPSEAYFHTLLHNDPNLRVDTDYRRLITWDPGAPHPRTITADDVRASVGSGAHSARKLDLASEPDAFAAADDLGHPG